MKSTDKQAPSVAKLLAGHSTENTRTSPLVCTLRGRRSVSSLLQCTHRPEASIPLGLTQLLHSESFNCALKTRHPPELAEFLGTSACLVSWRLGEMQNCVGLCVCSPKGFVAFGTVKKSKGCLDFLQGVLPTSQALGEELQQMGLRLISECPSLTSSLLPTSSVAGILKSKREVEK